jgi:nucleotide-binding universal stress UspA family protein
LQNLISLISLAKKFCFHKCMKKKLLVPLDGSQTGESALPWAKFFAEKQSFAIELISCFRPLSAVYSYPDFATPPPVAYDLSGFLRTTEKYLRMCVSEHDLPDATTIVKEGDPAELILQHSESDDIEAILLSSHGRGGLGRWLLGSTATKLVRGSRKPVYVFQARKGEPKPPSLDKILVCVDGSKVAEEALEVAARLASAHGSEITLYRAVEFFPYPASAYAVAIESERKVCQEYLDELAQKYKEQKVTTLVDISSAGQGILDRAPEHDLVIVTSHGLSGFERWLLGSVTEKVLHRIEVPLLVIHSSKQQD